MATLADVRTRVNEELAIGADADTTPWTVAQRNRAIGDAYAELWRVGVWKPVNQTITTVDDTWTYALTSIREVNRIEVLDTASNIIEEARFTIEDDGSGGNIVVLASPIVGALSLRVRGWQPYISVFASDAAVDDLPAEYIRVPVLKAKAILLRQNLSTFARFRERENVPPEMNVTVDQFLGIIAAAEREFEVEAKRVANRRPRTMRTSRVFAGRP